MPKVYPIASNFTGGKVSALVQRRTELKAYANGLKRCENMIVLPHGGATLRGGFASAGSTKAATGTVRIIPFKFSATPSQSYVLEFGNLYVRFFWGSTHAPILSGETPYEIVSPFATANIPNLRFAQSADVLYITDGSQSPYKLIRKGHADWEFKEITFIEAGNPFVPGNSVEWRAFTASDDTTRKWARNQNAFSGLFSTDTTYVKLITGVTGPFPLNDTYGISYGVTPAIPDPPQFIQDIRAGGELKENNLAVQYTGKIYIPSEDYYYFAASYGYTGEFILDGTKVITKYTEDYTGTGASTDRDFYANDGSFVRNKQFSTNSSLAGTVLTKGTHPFTLRTVEGSTESEGSFMLAWRKGGGIVSTGAVGNPTAFSTDYSSTVKMNSIPNNSTYYWYGNRCFEIKVWITDKDGGDGANVVRFGWAYREETAIGTFGAWYTIAGELTSGGVPVPATVGVAHTVGSNGYGLKDDAGGTSDGPFVGGGYLAQARFSFASGHIAGDYWTFKVGFIPIPGSAFKASSDSLVAAYPKLVTIFENRLVFANSNEKPSTMWFSESNNFDNFKIPETVKDNDPMQFTISSNQVDPIMWIRGGRRLVAGTLSTEYIIGGTNGPLTPSDFDFKPNTSYGSSFVDPVQADNALLFVEQSKLRLRKYYYRFEQDSYVGDDDSIVSYEEIQDGVAELAYQQAGLVGLVSVGGIYLPPVNLIWVRTSQYELKAITHEQQHGVSAWSEHPFATGVQIQSMAVIPGTYGDEIWIVAKRGTHRYVEYLSNTATKDNYGGADATAYQGVIEPLPFEVQMGEGQTSRGMIKRMIDVYLSLMAAQGVTVAMGFLDFATHAQTVGTVTAGPEDKLINLVGYHKDQSLVIKTGADGSGNSYPATVAALFGRMQVNVN